MKKKKEVKNSNILGFLKKEKTGIILGFIFGILIILIILGISSKFKESKDPLSDVKETLNEASCSLESSKSICQSIGKQEIIFDVKDIDLRNVDNYDSAFCKSKLLNQGKTSDFCYVKTIGIQGFSRTVTKIECVCYS